MAGVNVKSEIKPLKKVLLHRPGNELLNLTPATLEELLFDDIPFLRVAQEEHDAFAQILRDNGVEVVYLEKLMAEVLDQNPDLRETFLKQFIFEAGIRTDRYQKIIYDYLNDHYATNYDLVLKSMEGINLAELHTDKSNSLVDLVSDSHKLVIAPMPNLYFTRDPFAMIGKGVSINRMTFETRNRETIYGEYIFKYHPDFKGTPEYYSRYNTFHIEGGDILNISESILAIGISQRTEPDAIDAIAKEIFSSESPIRTILAFNIPNSRAFMHLDTVFTMIDHDKFTVHPGILGPLAVFEITPAGGDRIKVKEIHATLDEVLAMYLGHPVKLIHCGGIDRIAAEREQWNDGSNTLAIAPGKIVVYERNEVTNGILKECGLDVIEVPSAELSRGRGGPRCMSMPVWRED
jgi:arginine deiminase